MNESTKMPDDIYIKVNYLGQAMLILEWFGLSQSKIAAIKLLSADVVDLVKNGVRIQE